MKKDTSARRVAFAAVFTALSVAFMYIASAFPTGQLGFLGVSSLCGIAAVVEYGLPGGAFVWLASSVLGFLLVPAKSLVWLYALFFGSYPLVKALTERWGRTAEWCAKLVYFNACLTAAVFLLRFAFLSFGGGNLSTAVLYLLGNAVFVLFDIAVSRAIGFYMKRIHPKIHK